VLLIGLGVWLFARNYGMLGSAAPSDAHYWKRRIMGPVMLVVIGGLFLLENLNGPSFHRTWPVILLAVGAVKLFQGGSPRVGPGATPPGGGTLPPPVATIPPPPVPPPPASSSTGEVKNG